jgi:hypothetical protein
MVKIPRMRFLILLLLFFNILSLQARENSAITGKVNDEKKAPVPFANIVLVNSTDTSIVKAALTDESGNYKFENINGGNYKILVAQLGYEK